MQSQQSSRVDAGRLVFFPILTGYDNIIFCPGSSADVIVAHFAVNYHNEAAELGIDLNELYAAAVTDAEVNPPEWNTEGRQVNVYK